MRPWEVRASGMLREAEPADGAIPAEEQACCSCREAAQADGSPGAAQAARGGQPVSEADMDFRQAGAAWHRDARAGALREMQWRQTPPGQMQEECVSLITSCGIAEWCGIINGKSRYGSPKAGGMGSPHCRLLICCRKEQRNVFLPDRRMPDAFREFTSEK